MAKKNLVMIIDDSKTTRFVIRKILEKENYEVVDHENSNSALNHLKNNKNKFPDVILLDIMLKDTAGDKVFFQIKQKFQDAKVILISSLQPPGRVILKLKEEGVFDYIVKPVTKDNLLPLLNKVIQKN